MVRIYKIFIALGFVLLTACQTQTTHIEEDPYEGVPLKIAVVGGEIPGVREEQVNFKTFSLDELYHSQLDMYDAVFIMKNNLSDASNQKYVEMYKQRKVPFFFVGSKANTIPFQDMENPVSYKEEAEKVDDGQNFITGFLYEGGDEGYRGWSFSFPVKDSEFQKDDVKGIYSSVFKAVEKESNKKQTM